MKLEDAPALQRHADDKGVWLNLFDGFPSPYPLSIAEAWCSGGSREPAYGYVWGIECEEQVIGCIAIWQDDGWLRCNAEVGYLDWPAVLAAGHYICSVEVGVRLGLGIDA